MASKEKEDAAKAAEVTKPKAGSTVPEADTRDERDRSPELTTGNQLEPGVAAKTDMTLEQARAEGAKAERAALPGYVVLSGATTFNSTPYVRGDVIYVEDATGDAKDRNDAQIKHLLARKAIRELKDEEKGPTQVELLSPEAEAQARAAGFAPGSAEEQVVRLQQENQRLEAENFNLKQQLADKE
jgi:hypothetical protein